MNRISNQGISIKYWFIIHLYDIWFLDRMSYTDICRYWFKRNCNMANFIAVRRNRTKIFNFGQRELTQIRWRRKNHRDSLFIIFLSITAKLFIFFLLLIEMQYIAIFVNNVKHNMSFTYIVIFRIFLYTFFTIYLNVLWPKNTSAEPNKQTARFIFMFFFF